MAMLSCWMRHWIFVCVMLVFLSWHLSEQMIVSKRIASICWFYRRGDCCRGWHIWRFWPAAVTSCSKSRDCGQVGISFIGATLFSIRLLEFWLSPYLHRRVDTTNLDEIASVIKPWTKLVWLESPTNPRQQICDIHVGNCSGICRLCTYSFQLLP